MHDGDLGKVALDSAVAAGAVLSPLWMGAFDAALHYYFLVGGAILLALRVAVAWRAWRRG